MWNQRYGGLEYVYGREPNVFFSEQIASLKPGKILLPAEGEGRHAIYAAINGWEVEAFDFSSEGYSKAHRLADENGVEIQYTIAALGEFEFKPNHYDLVGLFFFHLPEPSRKYLHSEVIRCLKPGGKVVLEAFHTSQIQYRTGGPGNTDMLFDEEKLNSDFNSMQIEHLAMRETELHEGQFHQGEAAVVDLVARKPV